MDIGFITITIILLIGTAVVKWKKMNDMLNKVLFFTAAGVIIALLIICINHKIYSIMNVYFIRAMVMSMYDLMIGEGV
jgi:hypothetical protein